MGLDASLVIPTYNKKEFLELTLTSLANQTYPLENFEVVLVDDGSTDGTHELFSETLIHFPFQLEYVKQENAGRAAARNVGILTARGRNVIFIDDDQIVPPQFIENHLKLHQENRNLVVGGYRSHIFSFSPSAPEHQAILSYLRESSPIEKEPLDVTPGCPLIRAEDIYSDFNRVIRLSYGMDTNFERISRFYGENLKECFIPWIFFVTSNVSVGKSHLLEVGLFDENFTGWGGEDYELGYRLYQHGLEYQLCREAISYHQHHSRSFARSRESELLNYQYFWKKHPDIAIFLYWRKTYDGLSIQDYNNIVREAYQLTETELDSHFLTDYKVLIQHDLETSGFDLTRRQQYRQLPTLAEKKLQDKSYETALKFALRYIHLNAHRADEQQRTLQTFPTPEQWGSYSHLNNVARCWWVVANVYDAKGEHRKAEDARHQIVAKYPCAQYWNDKDGFVNLVEVVKGTENQARVAHRGSQQ